MASTISLLTGLSGLNANARRLEVIGNNISNINTTAYKSNRMLFAPALSRNLSLGSGPSGASGGRNPGQVGLGVRIAGTQRNFNDGAISSTGVNTDLAIEGKGLFVVERAGQQFFTRSGAFLRNSQNDLVTLSGERVQGYAVDENFQIIQGRLTSINIPIGGLTIAEATENVEFQGNLNADVRGLPTQGSLTSFDFPFLDRGTSAPFPNSSVALLSDIENPASPGNPLLNGGSFPVTLRIADAMRGNSTYPTGDVVLSAGTTIFGFAQQLNQFFGIVPGVTNPNGAVTGAQYNSANGSFTIVGNIGEANNISFDESNITLLDSTGASITNPFLLSQDPTTGVADGESVRTTFTIFDSLGSPVEINLTLAFQSTSATGTTWRYFVDSPDHINPLAPGINVATGTIQFDNFGQLVDDSPVNVPIGRVGTGAQTPLNFSLRFASGQSSLTALADADPDAESIIAATYQDGVPLGTLSTFSVGEDGIITGSFTNGVTRSIGQIAIATFTNPEGLVDAGNNLFAIGPNSGAAIITTPGQFGAGRVVGGALELSNVDLGEEFTNLILTTTGYSAASRVISTTDQLLQQLVALGR